MKKLEQEPNCSEIPTGSTTKNDLAHNLCDSCTNIGCEFQSGIVRTKCAFYMPQHTEPDNCGNYVVQDSTIKNNLEVDCISRQAVIDLMVQKWGENFSGDSAMQESIDAIRVLPSVKPRPRKGHWIETAEEYYKAINEKGGGVNENTDYFVDDIACSECLAKFSVIDNEAERFICCPNCGCRMVEPQESEDKYGRYRISN